MGERLRGRRLRDDRLSRGRQRPCRRGRGRLPRSLRRWVVDEWTTLVNPERDVSAGHIHGITARDVYGAPRFAEVAASILADSLRGRVLVAHNLSFEAQFLMGEFARLGHDLQLKLLLRHLHDDAREYLSAAVAAQPRGLLPVLQPRDGRRALGACRRPRCPPTFSATTWPPTTGLTTAGLSQRWLHCTLCGRLFPVTAAAHCRAAVRRRRPASRTWADISPTARMRRLRHYRQLSRGPRRGPYRPRADAPRGRQAG